MDASKQTPLRSVPADNHAMMGEGLRAPMGAMQAIHFSWISAFKR
jgi:hypothetical protein